MVNLFLFKMTTEKDIRVVKSSSSRFETLSFVLLTGISIFTRLWNFNGLEMDAEVPILTMIQDYSDSKFFIDSNPPFISLFYYQLSKLFGGNQVPVLYLKYINIIFGTLTVLFCFKTLKLVGIPSYLALWGSLVFSLENSTLMEQRLVTVYGMYLFLLSLFIYFFKSLQSIKPFNLKWWRILLTSSVLLGLIMSSHWTGLFVLIYSIYLSASEVWHLIDDISIPVRRIYSSFFTKIITNIVITFTIYFTVWMLHFDILDSNGRSYDLLPPKFQNSLNDNHLRSLNENVYFGSNIMLRNYKTGIYIHSHDDVFRTGHQQVTGHWNFNDADNLFQIQSNDFNKDISLLLETEFKVNPQYQVKFYHARTDSYLRIDPDSRPPVSEQEYNSEVTTNKNIQLNEGENDRDNIVFKLRINNEYTWDESSRKQVNALSTVFQIYNEKNNCYILSNGIELTDGLSSGQTELICIKEPVIEPSLWFIDWSDHPKNSGENIVKIPEISFWEKLYTVLTVLVNDNIHGKKGLRLENKERLDAISFGGNLNDLMYGLRGYEIWSNGSTIIYQLSNIITINFIVVSILVFGLIFTLEFIIWNPFESNLSAIDPTLKEFNYQTLDLVVGFFIGIIPLHIIEYPIFISSYIPSVYIGIMIFVEVMNIIRYYNKTIGLIILGIVSSLIFLSFWKFYPVIYGTNWTSEACSKLIILAGWNSEICELYN